MATAIIAQEFFKHFLEAFSEGQSLYTAMREARERLEKLENEYPCATWLPVICQNPAVEPTTWHQWCSNSSSPPRKHHISTVQLVSLVISVLILGIWQFGKKQSIFKDKTSEKAPIINPVPLPRRTPEEAPTFDPESPPRRTPEEAPTFDSAPPALKTLKPQKSSALDSWESPNGGTKVDLVKATVKGDQLTVLLHYHLFADSNSSVVIDYLVEQVSYTDEVTSETYKVIKDESGTPLAQPLSTFPQTKFFLGRPLIGHQVYVVWFIFPAPSENTETISIRIPGIPPFENIKIQ